MRLWCVWAQLPLEDGCHSLRGGLQSSGVSHGLHHPPPPVWVLAGSCSRESRHQEVPDPNPKAHPGLEGRHHVPAPSWLQAGSPQHPAPLPVGTVISHRGFSRQQCSMSICLSEQASPSLTPVILCYVKGKGPLSTTPCDGKHSLNSGSTTSRSTDCNLFAPHC